MNRLSVLLAIALATPVPSLAAPRAHSTLAYGRGSFIHEGSEHDIRVWYYQPNPLHEDARIIVVLHGSARNAEAYLGPWMPYAERDDIMVVVPEFSRRSFPSKKSYQHGNVERWFGLRPRDDQLFTEIERIFDNVRGLTGLKATSYGLYGHSAGAQLAHRMVMHRPDGRFDRVVAANAGVYLLPTRAVDFPYGLHDSGIGEDQLRHAFQRELIILSGLNDTAVSGKNALTCRYACAQGRHRVARAEHFYALADLEADRLGVESAWRLLGVSGVGHNHPAMTRAAIWLLE